MPAFMKLTGATTLTELALLRGQYGVTRYTVDVDFMMLKPVLVMVYAGEFRAMGRGETETEAFDDAFARLRHKIGTSTWIGIV